MSRNSKYITVDYEVREYTYPKKPRKEVKHHPKCPKCDGMTQYVYQVDLGKYEKIGLICKFCNYVFINKSYRVFKLKEDFK